MTNYLTTTLLLLLLQIGVRAQNLYFPPTTGTTWETASPASLGWCEDSIPPLLEMLDETNTKAFIVLKDGKVVIEEYFDGFTVDSTWYWASAGKSLTAFLVGLAQEQGHLNIQDPTSSYLGQGWTTLQPVQEDSITIWHQLTMTSGLDDGVPSKDCTLDTCLQYLAPASTRWAYHNAPYTLLDQVLENATGITINQYLNQQVKPATGITGLYLKIDYNNVYFSNARSMARFGLLALNNGQWGQEAVMEDSAYFQAMVNTSQNLNPSYGYLWWLNGKSSYLVPTTQFRINDYLVPQAPADTYAALGRDGQILNVVPSMGLVVVRMGASPGQVYPVPNTYNDTIWRYLLPIFNCATATIELQPTVQPRLYPNPATETFHINLPNGLLGSTVRLYNLLGEQVLSDELQNNNTSIPISSLSKGIYLYQIDTANGYFVGKLVVE